MVPVGGREVERLKERCAAAGVLCGVEHHMLCLQCIHSHTKKGEQQSRGHRKFLVSKNETRSPVCRQTAGQTAHYRSIEYPNRSTPSYS